MAFEINGVAMGIAPQEQIYQDIQIGTDHNGRPIFAAAKHVQLNFDQMSTSLYQQFSALHGASLTSVQLLGIDSGSYTTYSNANIHLALTSRPTHMAGHVSAFSVTIYNVVP
jgi:hypothetical protein